MKNQKYILVMLLSCPMIIVSSVEKFTTTYAYGTSKDKFRKGPMFSPSANLAGIDTVSQDTFIDDSSSSAVSSPLSLQPYNPTGCFADKNESTPQTLNNVSLKDDVDSLLAKINVINADLKDVEDHTVLTDVRAACRLWLTDNDNYQNISHVTFQIALDSNGVLVGIQIIGRWKTGAFFAAQLV